MGQQVLRKIQMQATADTTHAGQRVDQVASQLFDGFSRSRLATWIKSGELRVNGNLVKASDKLLGTEILSLVAQVQEQTHDAPEAIQLDVIYRDDDLLVINKPTGLVVHPAAGHADGTLMNGLLHLDPQLAGIPRAGIVHRLDRDTTGLMVVARTLEAQTALVEQLQDKSVHREYEAIVVGVMTGGATIDAPVDRHPKDRKRQAVVEGGKPAVTHYKVEERFRGHTLIQVRLETGRTHQIRVHLAYKHYPLVGDTTYGGRLKLPAGATEELREALRAFPRQALHARKLGLIHPSTGDYMEFEAPRPADLAALVDALRQDRGAT
jgi:23S rRNA pseudouridine1911/1915/1917 synthase